MKKIINNVLISCYNHLYASDSAIKENSLVLYRIKSSAILLRCMRHIDPQKRNSATIKIPNQCNYLVIMLALSLQHSMKNMSTCTAWLSI